MADTKELILDAAEQLFSQRGFDATSLRQITAKAEVNLAAVNYHFQSKEALIAAVFSRRMGPINAARLKALDRMEAEAGDSPVPLEKILEAFVGPVLCHPDIRRFKPLMARMYTEAEDRIQGIFIAAVAGVVARFGRAFQRALPELSPRELHWRLHFLIGMMAHALGAEHLIRAVSHGLCDPADCEALLPRILAFAKAGMTAPPPDTSSEEDTTRAGASCSLGGPKSRGTAEPPAEFVPPDGPGGGATKPPGPEGATAESVAEGPGRVDSFDVNSKERAAAGSTAGFVREDR